MICLSDDDEYTFMNVTLFSLKDCCCYDTSALHVNIHRVSSNSSPHHSLHSLPTLSKDDKYFWTMIVTCQWRSISRCCPQMWRHFLQFSNLNNFILWCLQSLLISPTVFSVTSSPNLNVTVTDLTAASVVTENVSSVSTPLLMITVGEVRPAAYESYIFLFGHCLQRTFPSFLSGAAMPRALRYSSKLSQLSNFQLPRNASMIRTEQFHKVYNFLSCCTHCMLR